MRFIRSLLFVITPVIATGCDPLSLQDLARILAGKIDDTTAKFLSAVDTAQKESDEWRGFVDQARRDLIKLPPNVRIESMAMTDFMIDRAKENASELASITAQLNRKEYPAAMKALLSLQQGLQKKHPPKIGSVLPDGLDIVWLDHHRYKRTDEKVTTIVFVGYNFDPANKKKYGVEIRDKSGKVLRTGWDHLAITSPYLAQIDINAGSGINFNENEANLVLLHDDKDLSTVPVRWGERPPLVVLPKIMNIKALLQTDSHKEAAGEVELTYFHNGRNLGDSRHKRKISFRILNQTHEFEYDGHIGAHEVWEKGRKFEFGLPAGLKFNPDYKQGEELKVIYALGAVPGQANINWRGNISFTAILNDGREIGIGESGGFWFRNNVVEDPVTSRGNRTLEKKFQLPPLPPK